MRKSLRAVTTAAATAILVISPLTTALAATPHDVLTTGKAGGANVKVHAVLHAGLKARTSVTFTQPGTTNSVKCTRSTLTTKVTANPARPGSAILSLTGQTFGGCNISIGGVRVISLRVKLQDRTTISDAKGDPVTVFQPGATIKLALGRTTFTCTYAARRLRGHASNTGQVISFSKQVLSRSAGSSLCPAKGAFSATYGPVVDMSVRGHPHVFVS
jgi:hypothetical protein